MENENIEKGGEKLCNSDGAHCNNNGARGGK